MSRLKPPFGTTAELTTAVMQERDLAYDTTLDRFVMGDGVLPAGKPLAFLSEVEAAMAAATTGDLASAFLSGDATPSVLDNSKFITAGSTAITNFDDGVEGQTITVYRGASDIVITENSTIDTILGVNLSLTAARPSATFRLASGVWKQVEEAGAASTAMLPVIQASIDGAMELLDQGAFTATGTTTAGHLADRSARELWAEDFGAAPAASAATNATALQAWINACASTGKTGRIGPGTFATNAAIIVPDGVRIVGSGYFSQSRTGYTFADTHPTVIQGSGISGTNSVVLRVSATAVGVAGTDFAAPGTDDLQDVMIRDIHIDANGAQYAAVYYRCGNGSIMQNISHGGASVAGAYIIGCFATAAWEMAAYDNEGRGFLIGQDTADTSYGAEATINDMTLKLRASNNGQAGAWSKFHATNQFLGCGVDARISRGSKLDILAEGNAGRAAIVRVGASTGGYAEVNLLYAEGNGDGLFVDYEDTAKNLRIGAGFLHPGNGTKLRAQGYGNDNTTVFTLTGGAGLTVSQIEVYVSGARLTPTTDYTVADSGADLNVTFATAPASTSPYFIKANLSGTLAPQDITITADSTDGGPTNPDEWLVLHDLSFPTVSSFYGFINSNSYKYRVERCSTMYYANREPEARYIDTITGGVDNDITNPAFAFNARSAAAGLADDAYGHDRWYALTQTTTITVSTVTNPENGQATCARLTQDNVTSQRMGYAHIIESERCRRYRSDNGAFQLRIKCSAAQAIRYAILEWTGTADAVTSDVVSSWTSTQFRAGGFFNSTTLAVLRTGSLTPSAGSWADMFGGTIRFAPSASMTNIIVVVWTEAVAAQNVTLDIGAVKVQLGNQRTRFEARPKSVERGECERFYYTPCNAVNSRQIGIGQNASTTVSTIHVPLPTTMRATPTLDVSDVTHFSASDAGGTPIACTNLVLASGSSPNLASLTSTVASGLVAGNATRLSSNSASARIGFLSEL